MNKLITIRRVALCLVIDFIIFMYLFGILNIAERKIFPYVLIVTIFISVLLNISIMFSGLMTNKMGLSLSGSVGTFTGGYFAVQFLFTTFSYESISTNKYLLISAAIFLVYFVFISMSVDAIGGYVENNNRNEIEKTEKNRIKNRLLELENKLKSSTYEGEKEALSNCYEKFEMVTHRVSASTPFGRVASPEVENIEQQINAIIDNLNDFLETNKSNLSNSNTELLSTDFEKIYNLIKAREKMIIK